ncbi:putative mediator of RNA polymerase II transcription subunit 19b [Wolffia australiana]
MESDTKKFGRGTRELNGAVDLISHYKLEAQHEFFCRKPLPVPISETHYLHNAPGDTEIRHGVGMELEQLFVVDSISPSFASLRETGAGIRPFDLDSLRLAFPFREASPVELPAEDRGLPTVSGKVKEESKDKSRKHKKHRDKESKSKEHKKHKHRHKDRSKEKDRDKDKDRKRDKDKDKDRDKKDKKRKHEGGEDAATEAREPKRNKTLLLEAQPALFGRQNPS